MSDPTAEGRHARLAGWSQQACRGEWSHWREVFPDVEHTAAALPLAQIDVRNLSNLLDPSDVEVYGPSDRDQEETVMAQYAVLIYANDSAHAPDATSDELEGSIDHAEDLAGQGSMVAAYALTPRDMATSIRGNSITDGPFLDSKEVVAGFYVLEAPDLDAALAIARTNPVVHEGGGVEVRPVHSGGPVERTEEPAG